jgi:hypothetical protein
VWATNTVGTGADYLIMQSDGNLVLYNYQQARPLWATNTVGAGRAFLILQDDRNLVLIDSSGRPAWSSDTSTPGEWWEKRQFEASPELMQASRADAVIGPIVEIGVNCSVSVAGALICVGAMIAIAVVLEFTKGKPPFGKGNDLRVIGGNISETVKVAGRDLKKWVENPLGGLEVPHWKLPW